jgi:hypothetical protein
MEKFEYRILIAADKFDTTGGVIWFADSNMEESLGSRLSTILNDLGAEGWEVSGIGDIGFSKRPEVILKRRAA